MADRFLFHPPAGGPFAVSRFVFASHIDNTTSFGWSGYVVNTNWFLSNYTIFKTIGYFPYYHIMVYKIQRLVLHNIKNLSTFERLH
jgi:hypothetical protein